MSPDVVALVELVRLADTARAADMHGGPTTRATVEASLAAHDELDKACEAYRRKHHPKAGRVVANGGQVFTVSPTGRSVRTIYGGAS